MKGVKSLANITVNSRHAHSNGVEPGKTTLTTAATAIDERLDIVNENDEVVGSADKMEIYRNNLSHRIVHILITNAKGEIALQLRSKEKRYLPGYWSTSVGGHVQSGEDYRAAARREAIEELGVDLVFEEKGKYKYQTEAQTKQLALFHATCDGPYKIGIEEVERVSYFSPEAIQKLVDNGEKIHPELCFLLRKLGIIR